MHPNRQARRANLIIGIIATLLFIGVSAWTISWVSGLKFDRATGSFQQTVVIAINSEIDNVTVSLNGKVVAQQTPLTLNNLTAGRYQITLTKPGFFPFERFFQLALGQAGIVNNVTLIAEQPQLTSRPTATYLPSDAFDVGLSLENGELLDYANLVSRFSTPIAQAHRFNDGYLYQQGDEIHLFFPAGSRDYLVYRATTTDLLKINRSPSNWSVVVFDGSLPQELELTVPSAASVSG